MAHGKKFSAALAKVDIEKLYSPQEAIALAKEIAFAKFNETVELHFRLGIDPRHSDQQVRSTVILPHGLGKTVRILAFVEGEAVKIAEDAGVDFIATDEVIERIEKEGWLDFDATLAIPSMMRKIGKLGKTLGRKGLMPSPKAGNVVQPEDIPQAVSEAKAGKVQFRNDKTGNLHVPIGKIGFEVDQLSDNLAALLDGVQRAKPSSAKGTYIKRLVLTTTMGPGIRIDPNLASSLNADD